MYWITRDTHLFCVKDLTFDLKIIHFVESYEMCAFLFNKFNCIIVN